MGVHVSFTSASALKQAIEVLGEAVVDSDDKDRTATVVIQDTNTDVRDTLARLAKHNLTIASLAIHKPTLDDVFLSLTGKQKAAKSAESAAAPKAGAAEPNSDTKEAN